MKVTLRNIYGASNILALLVEQKLPIRVAFRLTRLITRLNEEYTNLDTTRKKLVEEYGDIIKESDPANPSYNFTQENQQKFAEDFENLLQEEVEIEWETISFDDLGKDTTLSVRELNSIGFIFKEFEGLEDETAQKTNETQEEVATA
jgi:glycyl-tRNA synthetase alpha subunit